MKVIVAGSRDFDNYRVVRDAIDASRFDVTEVVCGGADGVDDLGFRWAYDHRVSVKVFMADWDNLGKSAGPIRNKQMADYAGQGGGLVLVWDGISPGSRSMKAIADLAGLRIYEKIFKAEEKENLA